MWLVMVIFFLRRTFLLFVRVTFLLFVRVRGFTWPKLAGGTYLAQEYGAQIMVKGIHIFHYLSNDIFWHCI